MWSLVHLAHKVLNKERVKKGVWIWFLKIVGNQAFIKCWLQLLMQLEGVNDAAVLNNISSWNLPVNF